MKLVITVSDGDAETTVVEDAHEQRTTGASTNGRGQIEAVIEARDGGPVPEVLLSMESEVAAGQRRAPGQP